MGAGVVVSLWESMYGARFSTRGNILHFVLQKYEKMAANDKARYEREMAAYKG